MYCSNARALNLFPWIGNSLQQAAKRKPEMKRHQGPVTRVLVEPDKRCQLNRSSGVNRSNFERSLKPNRIEGRFCREQMPNGYPNVARSLLAQKLYDQPCTCLDKLLLLALKGSGEVTFGIHLGGEPLVREDRHHDLRFHERGARKVTRVRGDVLDHDDFPGRRCGAAQPGVERDAGVWCEAPGIRANVKVVAVSGVDDVESHPVVPRHLRVKTVGDKSHQGFDTTGCLRSCGEVLEKCSVRRVHRNR
jgi:hypothetical protein